MSLARRPASAGHTGDVRKTASPKTRAAKRMTDEEAERSVLALVDEFSAAEPQTSAVDDLLQGRR